MSDMALIVRGLGKRYKGFALEGVDFAVPKGAVLGLIGPNGAGKTTTLRLIMGLARPDEGSVRILGETPGVPGSHLLDRVGFVFDSTCFYGNLSCLDNALWLRRVYSKWDSSRFGSLMARFAVPSDKKVDALSRGQRSKFALAVALSHGAELLVLDEPTSGLDPSSRSEILDTLYEFMRDGQGSVLFSTHVTTDLERIADYVAFIDGGRMRWCEETSAALERHALVKGGLGDWDALKAHLVGARLGEAGFEGLSVRATELRKTEAFQNGRLCLERASLEDIMVYSTREDYRVRLGA